MGFITKLKELFGIDSGRQADSRAGSDVDVTVERKAGERESPETESAPTGPSTDEPATETEAAVKDPIASGTEASGSTESLVEESVVEGEKSSPAERAEPAEAAGPTTADEKIDIDDVDAATEEAPIVDIEAVGESTDVVKGIGPAYAERLADAGVETVGALADADPEALAEETGVSEGRIGRWIDRAQARL